MFRFLFIIILVTMMIQVHAKYTAIGREEMRLWLGLVLAATVLDLLCDSNVVPMVSPAYPYFASIATGVSTACWVMLGYLSLVPFQVPFRDGSTGATWTCRILTLTAFVLRFLITLLTTKSILLPAVLSRSHPILLFCIYFPLPLLMILSYFSSQIYYSLYHTQSLYPLGDILLAFFFFSLGQITTYVLSEPLCEHTRHYFDGLLMGAVASCLACMFVYKYWDGITREGEEDVGVREEKWKWHVSLDDPGFGVHWLEKRIRQASWDSQAQHSTTTQQVRTPLPWMMDRPAPISLSRQPSNHADLPSPRLALRTTYTSPMTSPTSPHGYQTLPPKMLPTMTSTKVSAGNIYARVPTTPTTPTTPYHPLNTTNHAGYSDTAIAGHGAGGGWQLPQFRPAVPPSDPIHR